MSSRGHDFILEMVQMKMKKKGYQIVSSECRYRNIKFKIPPTILNHRPDTVGYNPDKGSVCIGEAKYYGDLNSSRSQTQIIDFIGLTNDKEKDIRVIFGIPLSEDEHFQKIIQKHDLELNEKVDLLKIPDRLIPREQQNEET